MWVIEFRDRLVDFLPDAIPVLCCTVAEKRGHVVRVRAYSLLRQFDDCPANFLAKYCTPLLSQSVATCEIGRSDLLVEGWKVVVQEHLLDANGSADLRYGYSTHSLCGVFDPALEGLPLLGSPRLSGIAKLPAKVGEVQCKVSIRAAEVSRQRCDGRWRFFGDGVHQRRLSFYEALFSIFGPSAKDGLREFRKMFAQPACGYSAQFCSNVREWNRRIVGEGFHKNLFDFVRHALSALKNPSTRMGPIISDVPPGDFRAGNRSQPA